MEEDEHEHVRGVVLASGGVGSRVRFFTDLFTWSADCACTVSGIRKGGEAAGRDTPHPFIACGGPFLLCLRRAGPRARVRHHCMPENMDRLQ